MQFCSWKRLVMRKPIVVVVLFLVILMALITITRLTAHKEVQTSVKWKVTIPIELGWPTSITKSQKEEKPKAEKPRTVVGEEQLQLLREVFPLLDSDKNGLVSVDELRNWIISKVKEHLQGALRENIFLFTAIDLNPRNGKVTWDEYHSWFLKKHGINDTHLSSDDDKHAELQRNIREKIAWDQAAWSEAAKTDPDFLNIDEFLSFRHPESSHTNLLSKVDDLLGEYDQDADDTLSWDEYILIPSDNILMKNKANQREEFDEFLDRNKDGKIDKREILAYMDPRNPRHSHLEAETLIQLSDKNGDSQLTLDEILQMADAFIASKVINTEKKFHDEF